MGAGGGRGDRGSVSLWVVIFTFTTLALLVLVVDGGQAMNAKSLGLCGLIWKRICGSRARSISRPV